jgi:hypothetical protein
MSIARDVEMQAESAALRKRIEELENAVLELTTRVRVIETTRPTLSLKKGEKEIHG